MSATGSRIKSPNDSADRILAGLAEAVAMAELLAGMRFPKGTRLRSGHGGWIEVRPPKGKAYLIRPLET